MNLIIWSNSSDSTAAYIVDLAPSWLSCHQVNSDAEYLLTIGSNVPSTFSSAEIIWYRRPFENRPSPSTVGEKLKAAELEEALWNLMLEIPFQKWMNFPTCNWLADKKASQLTLASECGLRTPPWIITNDVNRASSFLQEHNWDCIVKPLDRGYINHNGSIYHIYTNQLDKADVDLSLIASCPSLMQKKVNKAFDVRTVFVNGKAIFVGLYGGALDVRRDEMKDISYEVIEPPTYILDGYYKLMKKNRLRFCTSDFVVDKDGSWFFLENNANGQWVWIDEFVENRVSDFFFENLRAAHD
jgi:hypothetical protein